MCKIILYLLFFDMQLFSEALDDFIIIRVIAVLSFALKALNERVLDLDRGFQHGLALWLQADREDSVVHTEDSLVLYPLRRLLSV